MLLHGLMSTDIPNLCRSSEVRILVSAPVSTFIWMLRLSLILTVAGDFVWVTGAGSQLLLSVTAVGNYRNLSVESR